MRGVGRESEKHRTGVHGSCEEPSRVAQSVWVAASTAEIHVARVSGQGAGGNMERGGRGYVAEEGVGVTICGTGKDWRPRVLWNLK